MIRPIAIVSICMLAGCFDSTDSGSQGQDLTQEGQVTYLNHSDVYWVSRVFYSAGNSSMGHKVGYYRVSGFKAGAAQEAMRERDVDRCDYRLYSTSKVDAIAKYNEYIDADDTFQGAVHEYPNSQTDTPQEHREKIDAIVEDPANVAVFASTSSEDAVARDPEMCSYMHVWVYRADGTAVVFDFDHTD